jgi:glycosyltransferase involved in cell wall biosynthesis
LLHHARALAYPSLDEGFGFPILEAMGVGTPVVASSVGSIPEVAGDAAELVPLGDDAALATALLRAHRDGTRRGELIELGRAQAAKFSWTRTAREMIALYHSLAMESSR